jgi:predicted RNase H-like nuclease
MWTRTGGIVADVRVVGVDGVRERWLAADLELDPEGERPARARWHLGAAADVLGLAREADVAMVGVDMPVGLVARGPRRSEHEARALLGRSASSIFATAPQPAFAVARTQGTTRLSRTVADAASRAAGAGGVSTQAWMIAGKVLEVEDAVRALGGVGARVVEVHPETSFAVMAAHFGLPLPPGKRSAAGAAHRVRLLQRTLPGLDVVEALTGVPVGCGPRDRVPVDDALDALAAACSALRHAYGQARVLGTGTEAVWSDGTPAPGRAVIVV